MHSHDRTLLAKLGFQDLDKQNPLHDKACRYLGTTENSLKLWSIFNEAPSKLDVEFEHPVEKGVGKYQATIGFIDLLVGYRSFAVCVEVKISRELISDVVRQIKLYQSYEDYRFPQRKWILASPWPITASEKQVLDASKIKHIRLGDGFKRYCEQTDDDAVSDTL